MNGRVMNTLMEEPWINLRFTVMAQHKNESNQYVESAFMALEGLRDFLDADPNALGTMVTEMVNRTLEAYGEEV